MDFTSIAFYLFAAVAVLSALAVISLRDPVHAVLSLIVTFFSVACVWLIAGAEFLGVALILVYVGAVMVLFLFVIMMLDMDTAPLREGFVRYLPVGLTVAIIMLAEILILIGVKAKTAALPAIASDVEGTNNVTWLARKLFTEFLLPFETAAVILTVAVIAAVMLTLRRRVGARHQNPAEQARARAKDRFTMVKMDAEVSRPLRDPEPVAVPADSNGDPA
ncbi:NADH-quinone oxidoreductase subunit J [Aquilutibacter rugosus]|uniref:NADH-quinone oxidoreductase subunit J n=1 Tax=Aquilutibacter rugosus TaxID=3115820 RepID=UPI002F3F3C4B